MKILSYIQTRNIAVTGGRESIWRSNTPLNRNGTKNYIISNTYNRKMYPLNGKVFYEKYKKITDNKYIRKSKRQFRRKGRVENRIMEKMNDGHRGRNVFYIKNKNMNLNHMRNSRKKLIIIKDQRYREAKRVQINRKLKTKINRLKNKGINFFFKNSKNEKKKIEFIKRHLDEKLDRYMGLNAVKNQLDKQLDDYFNQNQNSTANMFHDDVAMEDINAIY